MLEPSGSAPPVSSGRDLDRTPPCRTPEPWLHIVGRNALLNRLLQAYLETEMPFPCTIDAQTTWNPENGEKHRGAHMVLFDCHGLASGDLWTKLGFNGLIDPASVPVVLFNICDEPDIGFEKRAIEKQVRGVFYHTEPLHLLPKGIVKILDGEIWFSRKTTSCLLMEQQQIKSRTEAAEAMLTLREKEILIAIAAGAGNIDIAQELRISLHTVKSHIYNIYKKLEVRNRLEATLWVARYL
jgi:LuxR family transcriptional regulator, positive regulator of biofilm formation